jgi:glycosyltransferase involved in cell wall biosynthesis
LSSQSQPLVSVIMPVYNSGNFLREAIESILGQTLADLELIAIDDGSTDGSAAILESFRKKDPRVVVDHHSQNQGLNAALHSGLAHARGKYVARMDADDISISTRLEKQAAFLENHPEMDIVGSAVQMVDERAHNIGVLSAPLDEVAVHWASIFSSPFMVATILFRRSVAVEHNIQYRGTMQRAADLDFLVRFLEYAHGVNFAEPLYIYRIHTTSITSRYKNPVDRKSGIIFENIQKRFPAVEITYEQVKLVSGALLGKPDTLRRRAEAADIYLRVWQAFAIGCTPDPAYYRLQISVALIGAKLALFPPFQPGWQKVLKRIYEIEPKWLGAFARTMPEMILTKIRSWLIRKSRK